jgi:cell division septum initiation protein DivIVA
MAVEEPTLEPTKEPDNDRVELQGFDRVRRGFAPDQVTEYLKRVGARVLTLESELEETRNQLSDASRERDAARAELASSSRDEYEGVSERVTELMRTFDQQVDDLQRVAQAEADSVILDVRTDADRIIVQARDEAERITADAREDAERIRASAKLDEAEARGVAERIVADARGEANRTESDLAVMRRSTLESFREIRSRTLAALGELESVIERGARLEPVVVVAEAGELAPSLPPPVPRPDR